MTPHDSPTKNHACSHVPSDRGSVDLSMIGLILGAIVAVGLIVLASTMLIGGAKAGKPAAEPSASTPLGESGSAPTQTIEQVLESVQVYVSSQEYGPAVTILKTAIGKYPTDADLRFALGDLYISMQEYPLAYEQYVAAIEHSDGADGGVQFTAGTLASTIGQPEMALRHYQAAMQAQPTNPDYPLYLANIQFQLNQLDAAKASLAIAGRLTPDRAVVWATWANIALRENKLAIAGQQITKARALEPRVAAWMIIEANIRKREGNPERSIELLSALPDDAADDSEVIRILTESYGMLGRPGDAASRMVDYATLHNDDAQAAFDAAVWLERAKQRDDAVLWGRRARDLGHPRAQGWLDTLPD